MRLLTILFLALCLACVQAQDSTTGAVENENETEADEATDSKAPEADKKREIETPDTFEASEKLSEDVPAPFPVDI